MCVCVCVCIYIYIFELLQYNNMVIYQRLRILTGEMQPRIKLQPFRKIRLWMDIWVAGTLN